jgi:mono/diheme cytochrome c family protein
MGPRARHLTLLTFALLAAGCRRDMQDQPKYLPYQASRFFQDGRTSRPLVPHTVARGHLDDDALLYTGKIDGVPAKEFPFPVTEPVLARGQERYNIYCAPCHDRVGNGGGMIVQRGYRRPTPFHVQRLRDAAVGYFFDVVTNGFGVMPSYATQISAADRWAIIAYIRALQLSQYTTLANVPEAEREQLAREAAARPADAMPAPAAAAPR